VAEAAAAGEIEPAEAVEAPAEQAAAPPPPAEEAPGEGEAAAPEAAEEPQASGEAEPEANVAEDEEPATDAAAGDE
jgi:hypothetical protein